MLDKDRLLVGLFHVSDLLSALWAVMMNQERALGASLTNRARQQ